MLTLNLLILLDFTFATLWGACKPLILLISRNLAQGLHYSKGIWIKILTINRPPLREAKKEARKMKVQIKYKKLGDGRIHADLTITHCGDYISCNVFAGSVDWPSKPTFRLCDSDNNHISAIFDTSLEAKIWVDLQVGSLRVALEAWRHIKMPADQDYVEI